MLNKEVANYLGMLDKKKELRQPRYEFDPTTVVSTQISKILNNKTRLAFEDYAEMEAFTKMGLHCKLHDKVDLEVYHSLESRENHGKRLQTKNIDEIYLKYWRRRATSCTQSFLKSVYADLVVTYTPLVAKKRADEKYLTIVIQSNIKNCNNNNFHNAYRVKQIERAFELSLELGIKDQIEGVIEQILALQKCICDDADKFAYFAFRILLLDYPNKYVKENIENKLVTSIRKRMQGSNYNLQKIRSSAVLVRYYSKNGPEVKMLQAIKTIENTLLKYANKKNNVARLIVDMRLAQIHFEHAKNVNSVVENYVKLTVSANKIESERQRNNEEVFGDMSRTKLEKYLIEYIFGNTSTVPLESAFQKISSIVFWDKNVTKMSGLDRSIHGLLSGFGIRNELTLRNNLLNTNFEIEQLDIINRNLRMFVYCNTVLPHIFDVMGEKYTRSGIMRHFKHNSLYRSIYSDETFEQLDFAIKAYMHQDYRISYHLLIPLIEYTIRHVFQKVGGTVAELDHFMGYRYYPIPKVFSENQDKYEKVFPNTGDAMSAFSFMEYVLASRGGRSLRNNFAHGFELDIPNKRSDSDLLLLFIIVFSTAFKTVHL